MKFRTWMSMTVVCLFAAVAMTVPANAQQIITFNAPNSGTGAGQGTESVSINSFGIVTGSVTDNNFGTHGFVGTPEGKFTNFDAPGANPVLGCTCTSAINDLGVVTGYLRSPNGNIVTVDPAGSVFTLSSSLNDWGAITGYYIDTNNVYHGFLRIPCGQRCEDNEHGTTAATPVSPPSSMQSPTIANQANPGFSGALGPMPRPFGRRFMPWYRSVGAQLTK
jgi:hypothetical protein